MPVSSGNKEKNYTESSKLNFIDLLIMPLFFIKD